jgi:hypothetical protein
MFVALLAMGALVLLSGNVNAEEDYTGWDQIFENDYMPESDYDRQKREDTLQLQKEVDRPDGFEGPYVSEMNIWGEPEYWPHQDKLLTPEKAEHDDRASFGDGGI